MTRNKNRVHAALVTVVGLAVLGLAPPAGAATATFKDAHGDMQGHGADLYSVRVVNEKSVRVLLKHDDLIKSPTSGSSFVVYLDVKPKVAGPEFAFVGGSYQGADYQLVRTDGWKIGRTAHTMQCDYRLRLNYDTDVAKLVIDPACLGDPSKIRVAVKTGGDLAGGGTVRDWLGRTSASHRLGCARLSRPRHECTHRDGGCSVGALISYVLRCLNPMGLLARIGHRTRGLRERLGAWAGVLPTAGKGELPVARLGNSNRPSTAHSETVHSAGAGRGVSSGASSRTTAAVPQAPTRMGPPASTYRTMPRAFASGTSASTLQTP